MTVYTVESKNTSKEDILPTPTPSAVKEEGNVTVVLANDELEGDEGLHELGYSQQLLRARGFKETFAMSLTCMAIPYGLVTAMATSIYGGGPLTMVWGTVIVTFLQWAVAFSLGELASRWPTAAGAYYWTYQLAPKPFRKILSYINGWLLLTAVLLVGGSVSFGTAQHVVATVNIVHPEWSPPQWVVILMAYALLVAASVPLLLGPRLLVVMEQINMVVAWLWKLAHLIALPVLAKAGRNSAKYAFTHYEPQYSGWGNGWTFFIGFLPSAYANAAPGFVLAMTEEVHNPAVTVPRAISYTMLPASLLISMMFTLPVTFTMPPSEVLLEAPGGIVGPHLYKLVLGSDAGAVVMMCGVLFIGFNCLVGINATASRQLFSFSRDHAVPGSHIWSKVTKNGNVPQAICLCLIIQALLCLIDLGSSTAFNSFVSTAVNSFMAAYALPIVLSLISGRKQVMQAPFSRRWVGLICNLVVMVWAPFALVVFSMPVVLPVTSETMNYSSVVLAGFITIASVWYFVYAKRVYEGPPESM